MALKCTFLLILATISFANAAKQFKSDYCKVKTPFEEGFDTDVVMCLAKSTNDEIATCIGNIPDAKNADGTFNPAMIPKILDTFKYPIADDNTRANLQAAFTECGTTNPTNPILCSLDASKTICKCQAE